MTELRIVRAGEAERADAFRLVEEYSAAVGVLLRETPESFARDYFAPRSGLWLARIGGQMAGCIGLRPLPAVNAAEEAGEVKRLYVRPAFRSRGVAAALLTALEFYAAGSGYRWLYLDSKDDLEDALRFYRRHGYLACDRYNDNPQATVFLRKPLRD